MDDSFDGLDHYVKAVRVATACLFMAGYRDDRDINLLFVLAQETYVKGQDRVRLTMRQLVPASRMCLRSLMDALDRLTGEGLVVREREPGATGASVYGIDIHRLIEVAQPYQDTSLALKPSEPVVTRKRHRIH